MQLLARRADWSGSVRVYGKDGQPLWCAASHRIDYRENTVRLVVPRRCLGAPRLARVNLLHGWSGNTGWYYTDSAHDDTYSSEDTTKWLLPGRA